MTDPNMPWEDAVNQLRESINQLIDSQQENFERIFIQEAQTDHPNAGLVTRMGLPTMKKPQSPSRAPLSQRIEDFEEKVSQVNKSATNQSPI